MNAAPPTVAGACDYCGLPLAAGWWNRPARRPPATEYCCAGCRIAAAVTAERGAEGASRWMMARLGMAVFFSMNVMVFAMALWTRDVYAVADGEPLSDALVDVFRYLCMLFALPVLLLLGAPLAENAVVNLGRGLLSTDLLSVLGVAAAYVYSAVAVFRGAGHIYFEVGCMVLVMVTLGRWLEAVGRLKTTEALDSLGRLLPDRTRVVRGGATVEVPLEEVAGGDCLRVLPGERIAADGRIAAGSAYVDEQVLTGDSRPALKEPTDTVLGGTLNLDGDLTIDVTARPGEGSFGQLLEAVREARGRKGRYQQIADRAAAWFIPAVSVLSMTCLAYHWRTNGFEHGLMTALAVVLIACPCALGLATPMAVWAALGRAAGAQVIFRSGAALERLAGVRAIRLDKTGTLTTGTARVTGLACEMSRADKVKVPRREAMRRAAAVAQASPHALSRAVVAICPDPLPHVAAAIRVFPGLGLAGDCDDEPSPTYLGSLELMRRGDLEIPAAIRAAVADAQRRGQPVTAIGWNGAVRGAFVFGEQLRPEAVRLAEWCRQEGFDAAVLSGDRAHTAETLAELPAGIPVVTRLLPEEKVAAIRSAQRSVGPVAMVGDGINDAPALAAADVGIAMGCGADVSRHSADVCLLGDDLSRLPWTIDLARRTVRIIRQNLVWAFGYNTLGVALACTGRLNPVVAAALMIFSSVLVVANSLRLGRGTDADDAWPTRRAAPSQAPALTLHDDRASTASYTAIQESAR